MDTNKGGEGGAEPLYDVIQIGYGPVSQVLALMLARQGWRVAIVERWTKRYALPRAVCVDHEMSRMLHVLGMRETLSQVSHPAPPYRWFNARWQELLHIDWSKESISGGTEVNFVHQPTLEEMFDATVSQQDSVDLNFGCEALAVAQTADYAEVSVRDVDSGTERRLRGRYIVGTDGANSVVRRAMGATQEDLGFNADWLVVDILPNADAELDIPPAAQWCNPRRPTTIVPAGVRHGRFYRRWEFMRLPHETVAELEDDAVAWRLLAPWVKPHQAHMVRNKVYTFRSLIARGWRNGRLLIAGDAAHVMPPFMGQGMCSGFRDDWNLAWKLDLILSGKAGANLLDTYEAERRPHVNEIIAISMYLGKVICIPDEEVAAERDRDLLAGTAPPPPPFPHLVDGVLDRHPDGSVRAPAGLLSPQGRVSVDGTTGWFDEIVGTGFLLISLDRDPSQALEEIPAAPIPGLKIATLIDADGAPEPGQVSDRDRRYRGFMDDNGIVAMIVRPDFYVYGGASTHAETADLVTRFAGAMRAFDVVAT